MDRVKVGFALLIACFSAACSGGSSEDERMPIGLPPPQEEYCVGIGGTATPDGACLLPDGTRCDQQLFFHAECGQTSSYCNQHGGQVVNEVADMGTFTTSYAVCTFPDG